MRTSATCRPTSQCGFTLLEMLVVLAIAGLLAGITLPNLSKLLERSRIGTERQGILSALENMGYWAYANGKPYALAEIGPNSNDAPFSVPKGWHLSAENPINYAVNGVCSGGVVTLRGPDAGSERLMLRAPLCRPEFLPGS